MRKTLKNFTPKGYLHIRPDSVSFPQRKRIKEVRLTRFEIISA